MNLGRLKYLHDDKVRPSQVWFTIGLWLMITLPAVFITGWIIPQFEYWYIIMPLYCLQLFYVYKMFVLCTYTEPGIIPNI